MIVNRNVVVKSCIWKQCESIAWVCWAHNHEWGLIKFCDSMSCTMETSYVVYFIVLVCVIHKHKFIMHSTIRWLTLKQSTFSVKIKASTNSGMVILQASTANAKLELLKLRPLLREQQLLKQHTQIQSVLAHSLKVAILTSYKKLSVGYFELKLHIHTLGISETYFSSCKKEHNRSPLNNCVQSRIPSEYLPMILQRNLHLSRIVNQSKRHFSAANSHEALWMM